MKRIKLILLTFLLVALCTFSLSCGTWILIDEGIITSTDGQTYITFDGERVVAIETHYDFDFSPIHNDFPDTIELGSYYWLHQNSFSSSYMLSNKE